MALWKCPECGFEKDVICPVCGADKEAGATCPACGSEYSHTTCPRCGSSIWHEASLDTTSYEEKIRDVLRLREGKYLTYYELMRLAALYDPAALEKVCENDPLDVKNISAEAFASREGHAETLTKIKGVHRRLAGKILELLEDGSG